MTLAMVMPEMDGIGMIATLGATAVRCPIVLMIGRLPIYTQTAGQLGQTHRLTISAVLQMPVPLEQLRAVLERNYRARDRPGNRQSTGDK